MKLERFRYRFHDRCLSITVVLLVCLTGCSRQQASGTGTVVDVEATSLDSADIELFRQEVRKQTESLREIAADLESQVRSGHSLDRALLLRIENQVSGARLRIQRIESLLERVESGSR